MKKLFYTGLIGLSLFEILNVYFIMPMPGSQKMDSIGLAYFLHSWRWVFRAVFIIMAIAGCTDAFRRGKKWGAVITILITAGIVYLFNFRMTADKMFLQPNNVVLKNRSENKLPGSRLVIGVENNGEAKAYPIGMLAYHHQVLDSVGGKPVIVTYCSVCRSGRVFEPIVNGRYEKFRLVGMDHFNAMFEDAATGSWWRQATGTAVAGKMKGKSLPEIESRQMTVDKWFELYPHGLLMQPDETFIDKYDTLAKFEQGKSKSSLTRTDSLSWKEKSWVVGIQIGDASKAYDWNDLKQEGVINDTIGKIAIVLALSSDGQSFAAFERASGKIFSINNNNELISDSSVYDFNGREVSSPSNTLRRVQAYQEFWHSWVTFHPNTTIFDSKTRGSKPAMKTD